MPDFKLTEEQECWASKRRQGVSPKRLREMLVAQKGRCALSDVPMVFDKKECTPEPGGRGCHPLSPAVDHVDPGNRRGPRQVVCYALNDLKGHLPVDCFEALQRTKAWKRLMDAWRKQAKRPPSNRDPSNREAFRQLLRPNAGQS